MNIPTTVEETKEAASKSVQKAKMAPRKETMKQAADQAKSVAGKAIEKGKELTPSKEYLADAAEKAKSMASTAYEKGKEMAPSAE